MLSLLVFAVLLLVVAPGLLYLVGLLAARSARKARGSIGAAALREEPGDTLGGTPAARVER